MRKWYTSGIKSSEERLFRAEMSRYSFPKRRGPEPEWTVEKRVLDRSVDGSMWTCYKAKGSRWAFLSEVIKNGRHRIWT